MLTGRKLPIALDVARDRLTNLEIAKKHGIGLRTVDKYKADPEFQAEVQRHLDRWRDSLTKKGIADRTRRLYRLNDRWRRCQAVIEQRAKHGRELIARIRRQAEAEGKDIEYIDPIPGITTGMIVLEPTKYGDVAKVDTALLQEMRQIEQQAAIETGQWKPKHEITGPNDGPLEVAATLATVLTLEELETIEKRMQTPPHA